MSYAPHIAPTLWAAEYQEHYLPSPYIARPIQPSTKNPNLTGKWLVLHRITHEVACEHTSEAAALMCARGERCTKDRHLTKNSIR